MQRRTTKATKPTPKPGPEPERLKLKKPWEDAVKDALENERPKDGWPQGRHQEKGGKT